MEPREAAWSRVSEQFAALGESLRRHYQEREEAEQPEQETRETIEEALRSLGDAADRLATATGNALRDPEVQREAKDAAVSLVDALGVTFSSLGGRMRQYAERRDEDAWESDDAPLGSTDRGSAVTSGEETEQEQKAPPGAGGPSGNGSPPPSV